MLCIDVIEPEYPVLHLRESAVGEALAQYEEKNISSFPVLDNEKLAGIISVKDILHLQEYTKIDTLQNLFTKASVPESEFFYSAFRVMNITGNIVPVIDAQNNYRCTVSQQSLLQALHLFLDIRDSNGGIIMLESAKADYSFSEIARLVESCEANIVQLNTYFDIKTELFIVMLKVTRNDLSDIVSILQQHDYYVACYFGEEKYENTIRDNYAALMNYLSI